MISFSNLTPLLQYVKKKTLLIPVLCIGLTGCGEMVTALSNMNQNMGARCTWLEATYYVEGPDGEWHETKYISTTEDGTSVREQERNWINSKVRNYLYARAFRTYYETSPYSNASYKIHVYCAQY